MNSENDTQNNSQKLQELHQLANKKAQELGYTIGDAIYYKDDVYFPIEKGLGTGHYGLPIFIKPSKTSVEIIRGIQALELCSHLSSLHTNVG